MSKKKLAKIKYFRCLTCHNILNHKMLESGECLGHRLVSLGHGTLFEYLKVQWWKLRGV